MCLTAIDMKLSTFPLNLIKKQRFATIATAAAAATSTTSAIPVMSPTTKGGSAWVACGFNFWKAYKCEIAQRPTHGETEQTTVQQRVVVWLKWAMLCLQKEKCKKRNKTTALKLNNFAIYATCSVRKKSEKPREAKTSQIRVVCAA